MMCKDVANGSRHPLENTKHMQLTLLYKLQQYNNVMPLGFTFFIIKGGHRAFEQSLMSRKRSS